MLSPVLSPIKAVVTPAACQTNHSFSRVTAAAVLCTLVLEPALVQGFSNFFPMYHQFFLAASVYHLQFPETFNIMIHNTRASAISDVAGI